MVVSSGTQANPTPERKRWSRATAWRVGTPIVVLLCGGLLAVSFVNADGTDLRPGRYEDLTTLVDGERFRYNRLEAQLAETQSEVDQLTSGVTDKGVKKLQGQSKKLADPAGTSDRSGAGMQIVLGDAPSQAQKEYEGDDPNSLVVHQQDIQAVVNALWSGGAQAITIAGKRIITTTGIKCSGSTVQLDGVPYPQPYVIEAVGDPARLQAAIDRDEHVQNYRADARDPNVQIGWNLKPLTYLTAPAYDGLLDVKYAKPLPQDK
ncbi:uncharacterized protein YlxW (UPF0749 family) [Nocardioides albertanoniae]|uniref:Uncharacterized protein YlxW (UPF0749 family) n=1 Tax=Nocardioides albertanoniae TaxID=1175486 RepID=A0A543A195_9ACTN|nr:DUF881 domain-containing protein [Nocardioides albertanoniae]TQL66300.1 uncharacterized protein YlxW (UPF0749 family) [Nocardioides albertanoniae]